MTTSRILLPAAWLLALPASAWAQELQPRHGDPISGLTPAELALFEAGKVVFETPLTEAEGVGPIFNEQSCAACHNTPAVGGFAERAVTRFGKAAVGGNPFESLDHLGGTLLQDQAIDQLCIEVVPPEATVTAARITPICFGAGLLEAIPEAEIDANEAAQASLGLSGWKRDFAPIEGGAPRGSRFGWKGGPSTVMSFSIDASLNEMGLTSVFLMTENAPNGDQNLLNQCDTVADPEDSPDADGFTRIDRMTHFQSMLAAPPQTPRAGMMAGEALFYSVGCADCHRESYVTGPGAVPAIAGRTIRPFSDFLIHDMGAEGDGIVDGPVSETEHMTRALWGLRHRTAMMHDGDALGGTFKQNVIAAINLHDGEGAASRVNFNALSGPEQDSLVGFLGSLGQVEFDYDGNNNTVDEFDYVFLIIDGHFQGVNAGNITPEDAAAVADIEGDGDFDLREYGLLQRAFTGQ